MNRMIPAGLDAKGKTGVREETVVRGQCSVVRKGQWSEVGGQWSGVGRAQSDRAIEMTDVSKAMELLELAEKWLEPFDVTDPFSIFRLEGYLSLKPDYRYGAFGGTT